MKKSVLLLMLFFVSILFAQASPVSLTDAQKIADANARVLWGKNLYSADPIPYYGFDGKVIAYCFNYALEKPFPSPEQMKQRIADAEKTDNRNLGWGVDEFGYLIIGANRGMPVFIEYSKSLSTDYALKYNLDKAALKVFPKGYKLSETYYLGAASIWNCVTDGVDKHYINLLSKPMTLAEPEFQKMLKERKNSWLDNDFSDEWTTFLDNNQTLDLNRTFSQIPGEEYMPFYEWSYGCVPAAATTVLAWWDNYHNLGKLIDYHGSRWDPIVETYRHHIPQLLPIMADRMETGEESGNTDPWDVNDGLEDAAASQGYTVDCEGSWGIFNDRHFYDGIVDYINNQTPGLATIDPGWLDYHTVAAVGYNTSPRQVFVHDANHPTLTTYSYSILECYWYVYPEATQTNGVKVLSPYGGTQWGGNGGGNEVLKSGDYFEIRWTSSTEVDSTYAKLFYNDEGGGAAERWFPITTFTANDGYYDWLVPNINCIYGTSTQYARIKIELYNAATDQLIAQDGSYGNFTINAGGSLAQLSEVSTDIQVSPDYCSADLYEENTWYALGVADNGVSESSYWKIELFDDTTFSNKLNEFYHWDSVNYIMVDNHHLPAVEWGVKLRSNENQPNISARAQLIGDPSMVLSHGTTNVNWYNSNVVKVWNVYLTPGDYYFEMNINGNDADLDFALFKRGGDGIFTIEEAVASSINPGGGGLESFHYSPSQAGYYGLCVSSRTRISTSFSLTLITAGVWDGSYSSVWTNPANWTSNSVPTFENDVVIPAGCPHYPTLTGGVTHAVYAKTITVETGARLYLDNAYLNVYGDLRVAGNLRMLDNNDVIEVTGNVFWDNGSTALSQEFSTIYCYQNWTFGTGSQVALSAGNVVFISEHDSNILCNSRNSKFNTLKVNKISGALAKFHENSTADLQINKDLNIMTGSVFTSNSRNNILINELFINNGNFHFDAGTVKFTGVNAYLECGAGDYFYNVEINTSGVTALLSNLYLHGDMIINSGGILATTYTLYISGSWYNNMGPTAFNKGTSTVVFNSGGQVEVVNGSFYIMEINNTGIELHFDQGISTCDKYNWTAGTLYIDGGTLTINDLVDNGLYGKTNVHSGTLNITQDASQQVHLNGELHISGGNMNVTGGSNYSYWPDVTHAWLEMSGGVLDFKTVGINIRTCPYLLTADITGGLIRTVGSIACDRIDFQPTGGTFEMYGTADKAINFVSQSNLPNLIINKTGTRETALETNPETLNKSTDVTRSNTVSLSNNLNLSGDLIVTTGTFNLNGHTVTTANAVEVYGKLSMTNALDILNVGTSIYWYAGQNSTVSNGIINVNQDWTNESGVNLSISTANTVNFIGEESSTLYLDAIGMYFGNVVVNKTAGITEIYTGTQYLNVEGNLTVSASDTLWFHNSITQIEGTFYLNGITSLESGCSITTYDVNLNGTITLTDGTFTVTHNCTQQSTSVLTINSGSFILDRPYTGNYYNFGGITNLNNGAFQITNDGIQFATGTQFFHNGGTLKIGYNFIANAANAFQPTQGAVEFIGSRLSMIECHSSNFFHDLKINKTSTSYQVMLQTNITVNHDLIVQGGDAMLGNHTHNVNRDVIINGGWLSSSSGTILNVGRSWQNNVGVTAFGQSTGTVNMISAQTAIISTETFYNLNINKTASSNNVITLNSALTMTTDGLLNIITGGLQLGENSILDANGNVTIQSGAALNLYSATGNNTMRLAGNLTDNNTAANTTTGFYTGSTSTLQLDGNTDQTLFGNYTRMYFGHVYVNKSGGKVKHSNQLIFNGNCTIYNGEWSYAVSAKSKTFNRDLIIESGGTFSDSTYAISLSSTNSANLKILGIAKFGNVTINKGSVSPTVTLTGNTTIARSITFSLSAGTLNLNGYTFNFKGTLSVGALGKVNLTGGSVLNLGNSSSISMNSGSQFTSLGTGFNLAHVTSSSGYYGFNVNSGATIAADYTVFEKMNANGINLISGCIVDVDHCFNGCYFQNGAVNGTLLQMNGTQNLTIWNATFPANTWSGLYNVSRTQTTGTITFRNFGGAFSGGNFDYNPNGNIIWGAINPPATPLNFSIAMIDNEAVLSWDPVPGVTGYRIYRALNYADIATAEEVGTTDMTSWGDESIHIYPRAFYFIKAFIE